MAIASPIPNLLPFSRLNSDDSNLSVRIHELHHDRSGSRRRCCCFRKCPRFCFIIALLILFLILLLVLFISSSYSYLRPHIPSIRLAHVNLTGKASSRTPGGNAYFSIATDISMVVTNNNRDAEIRYDESTVKVFGGEDGMLLGEAVVPCFEQAAGNSTVISVTVVEKEEFVSATYVEEFEMKITKGKLKLDLRWGFSMDVSVGSESTGMVPITVYCDQAEPAALAIGIQPKCTTNFLGL
ncbi:hypothetical protein HPP92_022594 [Vanilla planifolia]|uniref:Late embryogenesis abundant protein LEA-2 subgroup domain-containing protein n=1 Tax=Vanilla planifolia TaxID=51239 RepID=A0A835PPC5_VANPL|nr:hypothetical protein HPP92_022872 [Vanilla planifolia]KAG0459466.1 hypothetical protein HPP92_022594 [Vanilla planifolia]